MSVIRSTKINKLLAAILSVATIGAAMTTTIQSAQAFPHGGGHGFHGGHGFRHHGWGGRGWGYGAAGLGLGLLGVAAYEGTYARRCGLVRQFDEDGNYIGRVRVCRPAYVD